MSHRIIINSISANPSFSSAPAAEPTEPYYSFQYQPSHDQTEQQAAQQYTKIVRLLEKAVKIANGEPVE